jgi:hypothetical protein
MGGMNFPGRAPNATPPTAKPVERLHCPVSVVYSPSQLERLESLRLRRQEMRGDRKPESRSEVVRKALDIGMDQLESQLLSK